MLHVRRAVGSRFRRAGRCAAIGRARRRLCDGAARDTSAQRLRPSIEDTEDTARRRRAVAPRRARSRALRARCRISTIRKRANRRASAIRRASAPAEPALSRPIRAPSEPCAAKGCAVRRPAATGTAHRLPSRRRARRDRRHAAPDRLGHSGAPQHPRRASARDTQRRNRRPPARRRAVWPRRAIRCVRIPDGTAGGGDRRHREHHAISTAASATLLRRRTAARRMRSRRSACVPARSCVLPAIESHRRLRHQSGAHAGRTPSSFVTVSPELLARSDWLRHEVTATLRGSYTAYDKTPELDRPAFDGKVTGRLDVTRNTALIGEGTLIVGTDNPGSPNVQAGLYALPDLHHARRHVRPDAALQPRRGHRQGHAPSAPNTRTSQFTDGTTRAMPTATTIASAARCAPATT